MENTKQYFGLYDYIVFGAVLLVSAGIGLYYRFSGGRQKTFKEYLLADQRMSIIPVAFSLMASFMSAITLLGVSKENYMFGTQFVVINISYIISTPIVCYLYLPVFYRLQKISVYEYLEMRFGKPTRLCASLAFSLQMTLYMGIVLFAPALALSAVTGVSQTWSIISVGLVCTFYSSIGGMKAVLITDVFQSLLMFAAIFAVIAQGVTDFGVRNIFRYAMEGERLEFFNFSLDPRVRHTVWSLGIGGVFTYCSLYGVNQAQVQRLLTVRSLKQSRAALWLQWIILMTLSLSTSFSGLVLYAQYRKCDPVLQGAIANSDQILPFYVVEKLGRVPGLSGLFVSGIFSGSLSTVSSALNSLSAVTLQDYIIPVRPSLVQHEETTAAALSKIVALCYGLICMGIAFLAQHFGTGILQASLTIFGAVGGPLLALFTLGMLCRSVNQKGALCGLIAGLIMTLWIGFGQPKPPPPVKPLSTEGCTSLNQTDNGLFVRDISIINSTIPVLVAEKMDSYTTVSSMLVSAEGNENIYHKDINLLHELYAVSYMWVACIGFLITFILGNIIGLSTGGRRQKVDKILLSKYVWYKEDKDSFLNMIKEPKIITDNDGSAMEMRENLKNDLHETSTRL